jgi:hypothetical protein
VAAEDTSETMTTFICNEILGSDASSEMAMFCNGKSKKKKSKAISVTGRGGL